MKTKYVVWSSLIAALYFVLTVAIAPISYGPVQFRVSEALKVFVLLNPVYALAIGIGTFFANLLSPFAGPWDLVFMPLTDLAGGLLAWLVFYLLRKRFPLVPMIGYALTTGASVGLMLSFLVGSGLTSFWLMALPVGASELVILAAGTPLILYIVRMLEKRNIDLR